MAWQVMTEKKHAEGGQLKVVNSRFVDNGCYKVGPGLGGGAIVAGNVR